MGFRLPATATKTALNTTIPANAETLLATVGPVDTLYDSAAVLITLFLELNLGATSSTCTAKLRRGVTLTDALLDTSVALNLASSAVGLVHLAWVDYNPGNGAGVYTVTVTVGLGASSSTVSDLCLMAFAL